LKRKETSSITTANKVHELYKKVKYITKGNLMDRNIYHSEGDRAPRMQDHHQPKRCQQSAASTESKALTLAASPPPLTILVLAGVPSRSLAFGNRYSAALLRCFILGECCPTEVDKRMSCSNFAVRCLKCPLVVETRTVRPAFIK
jgi:hypothetical protein